jgi:ferredoxin-NADP reductase
MQVKKYHSELLSIKNPIEGNFTLEFRSLNGKYKFFPGQFLHLAIDNDYDGSGQWPESRCFSMQSNPDEETIRITYAVKGQFTNKMQNQLHIGSEVWLKLPYGDLFTKPHSKVNTVFIAGGTGITPFLSLFTHESFREYINPKIYLGFRSKGYDIYMKDLDFVKLCAIKTCYQDVDGLLDIHSILSENGENCDYFISGPPSMIKTFKQGLIVKGVSVNHILTDDWE